MSDNAKTLVKDWIEAVFVRHDAEAVSRFTDNENLQGAVAAFGAAFPDIEMTTEHLIAEDDLVAVRITARATHLGDFLGIAPTGRRWEATASAWYEVRDSKIVDYWINWDMLSIMRQIGAIPE